MLSNSKQEGGEVWAKSKYNEIRRKIVINRKSNFSNCSSGSLSFYICYEAIVIVVVQHFQFNVMHAWHMNKRNLSTSCGVVIKVVKLLGKGSEEKVNKMNYKYNETKSNFLHF